MTGLVIPKLNVHTACPVDNRTYELVLSVGHRDQCDRIKIKFMVKCHVWFLVRSVYSVAIVYNSCGKRATGRGGVLVSAQ